MKYVTVIGNPFDGLSVIGPFNEHEQAVRYGEWCGDDWHVMPLLDAGLWEDVTNDTV